MPKPYSTTDDATGLHGLGARISLAVLLPTLAVFGFATRISFNQLQLREDMYRLTPRAFRPGRCLQDVENEQRQARLRERGCDEVQGYHFSRPLPAEQIVGWLTRED